MTTILIMVLSAISLGLGFLSFRQYKKKIIQSEENSLLNKQLSSQQQSFNILKQKYNNTKKSNNELVDLKETLNKKSEDFELINKKNNILYLQIENMKQSNSILEKENANQKNIILEQDSIYKDFKIINELYIKPYEGLKILETQLKKQEEQIEKNKSQGQITLNKIKTAINKEKLEYEKLSSENIVVRNNIEQYKKDINLYQETFDYYEYGISEPIFGHMDSERYKQSIKSEIEHQKLLVSEHKGVINKSLQYKEESKSDFNKRIIAINKNILSAFNREVENISLNLTIKNFNKMMERLQKTFETLNKNNSINDCHSAVISSRYFQSKKNEISFKFKFEIAKERAREEQEEIKAQMRDEERESKIIEREQQKALKAAEKAEEEEIRFQKQLTIAQNELKRMLDEQSVNNNKKLNQSIQESEAMKNEMEDRIKLLQIELLEAKKSKDRNLSMAQQTKRGHVYVISNVGSFGEGVYKIGMTRRLEPLERVKELSGASVPFEFDVHAVIYSDNAPALEAELHRQFTNERVNLVNLRKEFFKVNLNDIQNFLDTKGIVSELTLSALANNYYESISIRESANIKNVPVSTLLRNYTEIVVEDEDILDNFSEDDTSTTNGDITDNKNVSTERRSMFG